MTAIDEEDDGCGTITFNGTVTEDLYDAEGNVEISNEWPATLSVNTCTGVVSLNGAPISSPPGWQSDGSGGYEARRHDLDLHAHLRRDVAELRDGPCYADRRARGSETSSRTSWDRFSRDRRRLSATTRARTTLPALMMRAAGTAVAASGCGGCQTTQAATFDELDAKIGELGMNKDLALKVLTEARTELKTIALAVATRPTALARMIGAAVKLADAVKSGAGCCADAYRERLAVCDGCPTAGGAGGAERGSGDAACGAVVRWRTGPGRRAGA